MRDRTSAMVPSAPTVKSTGRVAARPHFFRVKRAATSGRHPWNIPNGKNPISSPSVASVLPVTTTWTGVPGRTMVGAERVSTRLVAAKAGIAPQHQGKKQAGEGGTDFHLPR